VITADLAPAVQERWDAFCATVTPVEAPPLVFRDRHPERAQRCALDTCRKPGRLVTLWVDGAELLVHRRCRTRILNRKPRDY
jgi:hypothetical protein